MNEKSVKVTSKKIENKITFVTSVLGLIIVNIIWMAGIRVDATPASSFARNDKKENTKDTNITNMPLTVSLYTTSFE